VRENRMLRLTRGARGNPGLYSTVVIGCACHFFVRFAGQDTGGREPKGNDDGQRWSRLQETGARRLQQFHSGILVYYSDGSRERGIDHGGQNLPRRERSGPSPAERLPDLRRGRDPAPAVSKSAARPVSTFSWRESSLSGTETAMEFPQSPGWGGIDRRQHKRGKVPKRRRDLIAGSRQSPLLYP